MQYQWCVDLVVVDYVFECVIVFVVWLYEVDLYELFVVCDFCFDDLYVVVGCDGQWFFVEYWFVVCDCVEYECFVCWFL